MNIKRCFEILEVDHKASLSEVRQAYRDIVNVWHPDRFSSNPRLMKKAEKKLKEINIAYRTVKSALISRDEGIPFSHVNDCVKDRGTAEIVAETGTHIVLTVWSYLSDKYHHIARSDGDDPEKKTRVSRDKNE